MFVHLFQIILNFMYVCQSVSWLTSLMKSYKFRDSILKSDKYRDISCSGWDIFQNFLGDIPQMFLHYFQINTNSLYVCQSVSWHTLLLKWDKCRNISCSGWNIFQNFLGDIPGIILHYFQKKYKFYVCLSFC